MEIVISNYSFDYPQVDIFNNKKEALKYIEETAKEECRIDREENGWDAFLIDHAPDRKELRCIFDNHEDTTEFVAPAFVFDHRVEYILLKSIERDMMDPRFFETKEAAINAMQSDFVATTGIDDVDDADDCGITSDAAWATVDGNNIDWRIVARRFL